MPAIKFANLTDAKLHKMVEQAQNEIARRKSRSVAIANAQKILKNSGFTLEQLLGKRAGTKVAAKWVHKSDPSLTWSGRGRTPKWIKKDGKRV